MHKLNFLLPGLFALPLALACTSASAQTVVAPGADPAAYKNQTVVIEVSISREISAHMTVAPPDRRVVSYISFGQRQMVAYSRAEIDCKDRVRLTGQFFEVRGSGDPRSKGGGYHAWHFIVDESRCL
jgi:hypothetical protein